VVRTVKRRAADQPVDAGAACPSDDGVCADRVQADRALHGLKKKYGRRRPEADRYVRWADRGVQLLPLWIVGPESHAARFRNVELFTAAHTLIPSTCTFVWSGDPERLRITGRGSM
jgi:hypothetical protein